MKGQKLNPPKILQKAFLKHHNLKPAERRLLISLNSLESPGQQECNPLDLSDPGVYRVLRKSLKRLRRERQEDQERPYKERLKNLLNNVRHINYVCLQFH